MARTGIANSEDSPHDFGGLEPTFIIKRNPKSHKTFQKENIVPPDTGSVSLKIEFLLLKIHFTPELFSQLGFLSIFSGKKLASLFRTPI